MKPYFSISPRTGVATGISGYDYDATSITIQFTTGAVYTYTLASCGPTHLANMKRLADAQSGLQTYLNANKPKYASKR